MAAFEVPLPTASERREFLEVLSQEAKVEGFHVDAADPAELRQLSEVTPMTIHAAVWRGTDDDESVASIMDQQDHLGRAWIMFSKGEQPERVARFRESVMREVHQRWPGTLSLPIMPTGAIPLHRDLRRTPEGYRVEPTAAATYELPASSLLIAHD